MVGFFLGYYTQFLEFQQQIIKNRKRSRLPLLVQDLLNNEEAAYIPRCFIDNDVDKVGREIQGIPVWSEDKATFRRLSELEV